MSAETTFTVLHYTGYVRDAGGIHALIRSLAATERFACVLGVSAGFLPCGAPPLATVEFPALDGETVSPGNVWRARRVARSVIDWLDAGPGRVFHGHSRAGLLVALWLRLLGERRFAVSVHCYGRQRWFYRAAAFFLRPQLRWLSPAMRRYYGVRGSGWNGCIPGGAGASAVTPRVRVSGELRLGGAGAITRWKQWELVLQALALLPPDWRARVSFEHIGGGDEAYRGELLALRDRLGLGSQVIFAGPQPSAERLLGGIDALVVASAHEPFSIAMLEALAAGVPVLAADSGGAGDIVRHGENGWLYRTGDPVELARLIEHAATHPPVMTPGQIRDTAVKIETVAASLLDLYTAVAARRER